MENPIWSKRKFKIRKDKPAMRICEMNLEEAKDAMECFYKLSSAAGYADDSGRQNMWTGYECEAAARVKELEAENEELRHQKYKRCLAMAEWCDAEADVADADGDYEDMRWYQKWHGRWLEIADKFKESSATEKENG